MKENALITAVSKHITLTEEEEAIFKSFWTERILDKGEYLLMNGDVCRYDNYVISGALKTFYINSENGNEEILFFAIDDWWVTDIDSFSKQTPSIYNIQAIQQTTILEINYQSFKKLLLRIPQLEKYFRIILERYIGTLQKRIVYNNVYDAEHRYLDFLEIYPNIAAKVPQYLIASYLGVSAEFISRIRKKNKPS